MWSIESVVYYRIYNRDYNVLRVQLVNIDIEGRFDKNFQDDESSKSRLRQKI